MNQAEHPLFTVFIKVLEDWAMMLVEDSEPSTRIFSEAEPLYMSHVNMHGPFQSTISIVAQKDFMKLLTTNLLGLEPATAISEEELKDAFREMGNVLAGNFITEAYGTEVTFDILNPTVSEISQVKLEELAHSPQAYFVIADETPVCVTFNVDK